MAFLKYAKAAVTQQTIDQRVWSEIRQAALLPAPSFELRKASKVVLDEYDPAKYLLTHCTIVASVDTETSGLVVGRHMHDGAQIDRRFDDYLVTVGTSKYINNNFDAFERRLLLASFRTFVGAFNFVEHLQIPELSKGKIIDAAARDIGDSIYVDILVATERKHRALIEAISSGQLSTLSMGCFLPETPVTLADGRRVSIKDVAPGDRVLTHKGRPREVTNKQIRLGQWGMRHLKAEGVPDQISTTDNHPFFVLRPQKFCACGCGEELFVGDRSSVRRMEKRFKVGHDKRIFNPNNTYSLDEARARKESMAQIHTLKVEEVRADELCVGDYLIFPRLVGENKAKNPSVARARLLGYFLAEGSFLKRENKHTEVQFNFSMSEKSSFVAETVKLLRKAFPGSKPWVQERESRNTCVVHVTGKSLVSWFLKHGGEYSHRKRLHQDVLGWSAETQLNLLGAWLNGDGCKHVSGSALGTTTSYDLACQLHLLAVRCGIPARLECSFGGKHSYVTEAVVNGESLRHPETGKLAHFNLCFPKSSSQLLQGVCAKAPAASSVGARYLSVFEDMVVVPISEITPFAYEGPVFDLEVEEDHSYQVHGLAVHNCQVSYTQCTKCGNVAADETQLCRHIKYEKGSWFFDAKGQRRRVAELCGHHTEPESVKFIEGSWVANPAFKGAVLRSILDPKTAELIGVREKMQSAFSQPVEVQDPKLIQKAARAEHASRETFSDPYRGIKAIPGDHLAYLYDGPSRGYLKSTVPNSTFSQAVQAKQERLSRALLSFDDGMATPDQSADQGGGQGGGQAQQAPKEDADPLKKHITDLYDTLVEKVTDRLKDDLSKSESDKTRTLLDENRSNESLIKSAFQYQEWRDRAGVVVANVREPKNARAILAGMILYSIGGWEAVRKASRFTGAQILVMDRLICRHMKKASMAGDSRVSQTVIAVGGTARHEDVDRYLAACRKVMGRTPTESEKVLLIEKGKLFSMGL